ncbi:hypothetical protein [Desulforhopalus singaporensis]|uniref:Uncharacterized protein n=1 Tax=Desulforhopalus singaporensis TaxID=91360 RepID=A0A1H0VR73_9BACT|nr:hypothetical protein [Desulforhopalus singaporensis]SDP80698.1 hypothetical protein SAMN05660330_04190 [Desulforhopalus singaporensis]
MKLILQKDQKKGLTGKLKFIMEAKAELTDEESANLSKYKMGKAMLYTNLEKRGSGVLGMISRAAMGIEITVDDLVKGKRVECNDIMEMLALKDQMEEACKNFKMILDTMATFGGEEVIEY